jgi:sugar phosphate isomerase/epimerase
MTWLLSGFTDEAGDSPEEQIEACRETGLQYLELRSINEWTCVNLPVKEARSLQQQLAQAGVVVHMFGSPIGKLDIAEDFQTDLDRLEHLAQLSDIFGCRRVRLFSYYNSQAAPLDQWRETALARLTQLRDRAKELGMSLYHENETDVFGDAVEQIEEIAGLRDGETFRLIFDFANFGRTSTPCWDIWKRLKDRVDCFHFKDQRSNGEHVPIGQGDTSARQILSDAVASGWDGPCVLEPHLTHSEAVMATNVHGTGSQALAEMTRAQTFQYAARQAKDLLDEIGADYT